MTATPFALVSAEDNSRILAYGLDIDLPSGRDVITYRRDSDGRNLFTVHQSMESARRRYNRITPVDLSWAPTSRG
jgi:hypothetical protein